MICAIDRPRITVEMARMAFAKTGMEPKVCGGNGYKYGCILQALYAASGRQHGVGAGCYFGWALKQYGNPYAGGVMLGWDGTVLSFELSNDDERVGYSDGLACRRAILEQQPEPALPSPSEWSRFVNGEVKGEKVELCLR